MPSKRMKIRAALFVFAFVLQNCGNVRADAPPPIVFDLSDLRQEFLGFGTQIWAYNSNPEVDLREILADLNIRYVRVCRESATWAQIKSTWDITNDLGIKWVLASWQGPGRFHGNGNILQDVDGFAEWWVNEVELFDQHGMRLPYIELMNEPDSNGDWSTGIPPETYNKLVKRIRRLLDEEGFSDVGIVGPGLTHLSWNNNNEKWISALDSEGVEALAAWSSHSWDDGDFGRGGANVIEKQIPKFLDHVLQRDPNKPRFITEYATKEMTFHGQTYPHPDRFGEYDESKMLPYYSVTCSIPFAARVYENTLALLNNGIQAPFVWQANDEPTEVHRKHKSWGLVDLQGRPKPVFNCLKTLFANLPVGSRVVAPPAQDAGGLYSAAFIKDDVVLVGIVNDSSETAQGTIELRNAGQGLEVFKAIAFVPTDYGSIPKGIPGTGRIKSSEVDVVGLDNDNQYRLNVALPADSTLTVSMRTTGH